MRILITGSQGYIGSCLTRFLKAKSIDYVGVDTGFFREGVIGPPVKDPNTLAKDVRHLLPSDLDGVDVVVHLAGISNDPMNKLSAEAVYDPTRMYTKRLAQFCKEKSIRFIFASSCSIYGIGGSEYLDERSAVKPQTPYSLNKVQIESDLRSLADASFSPIALRFATIYGPSPRIRFDVFVNMLCGMAVSQRKIILNSDGMAWRPNLHILDACEAIFRAITSNHASGELLCVNVGDDSSNVRVIDVAHSIAATFPGLEVEYLRETSCADKTDLIRDRKIASTGHDVRTYRVSFAKIAKEFNGFRCMYSLDRGIRELLDYLRNIPLTEEKFRRREHYRLQQLEHLLDTKCITESLFWNSIDN